MKIAELSDGTNIEFEFQLNDEHFQFGSQLLFQRKGKAYFEPIRVEDRMLNLEDAKIQLNMLLPRENKKPIMWPRVKIQSEVHKKKAFYTIDAECEGKPYNRRGAYRQYVGDAVNAKVGSDTKDMKVTLKDISNSGFSFIMGDDIPEDEQTMVMIQYDYKDENAGFSFALSGVVVRKQELESNKVLYGCALSKKNNLIGKFVNYKQQEQLAKKNERVQYKDVKKDKK